MAVNESLAFKFLFQFQPSYKITLLFDGVHDWSIFYQENAWNWKIVIKKKIETYVVTVINKKRLIHDTQ